MNLQPSQHVPTYKQPTFSQSLDRSRPHTCLTKDPQHSGSLVYRYDDTGEEATFPNIWYNQTAASRIQYWRWMAANKRQSAKEYRRNWEGRASQASIEDVCRRIEITAQEHEQIANDIEQGIRFV